ncbi:MAG TPA: PadR family transcriptional regulator [Chloroflexia bacterium]|nr:PadR family transcriptional regulator [Chloroflexia bacterium]
MSYQLVLLGLLSEQPRHGYEIKQTFEQGSFAEYLKVSGGGLYYNLHKLVKEGYITEQNVEREGNYPDRHIYQITPEGRNYFFRLLRDTMSDLKGRNFFDPLDAALLFGPLLSRQEVLVRFQRQLVRTRARYFQLNLIYETLKKVKTFKEPYNLLLLDHSVSRLKSSMEWLEKAYRVIQEDPAFEETHAKRHPLMARGVENGECNEAEADDWHTTEGVKVWSEFEENLEVYLRRYNLKTEQAWREYEGSEKVFGQSPELLEKARLDYSEKLDQAWQEYESAVLAQGAEMEALIEKAQS